MMFSNSPVKTISEKIKPSTGLEKGKVSRLKFDRKSDYKTFLNFIKDNTKKLDIEKSDKGDSKKQAVGIMGVALLASIFGRGGDKDKDGFLGKGSLLSKAIEKAKLDAEAEARKTKQGSGGSALVSGLNTIQKFASKPGGALTSASSSSASAKESTVGQERVYNQNRRRIRKKLVNVKVAAEIGGSGTGGAGGNRRMLNVTKTLPEDPNIGNRPLNRESSLGKGDVPDDIKKATKLTQDFESGKITRQQYDNEMNKIKKFIPPDKTPKTADQIAKELGIGKKTLKPNFGRGIQTNLFNDPSISFASKSDQNKLKYIFRTPDASKKFFDPFRFNPTEPFMDDDVGNPFRSQDRRFKQGSIFDQQRTRSVVDRDKFFTAPSVPKGQPKLSGFDRFNRFSSRIFNSPAYKFGMFLGGLMANYKVEIIKQLLTPTSLADGTLQGAVNNKLLSPTLNFTDGGEVTNIFVPQEGVSSSIPLNFDGNANASKGLPSDLAAPPNNIFLDSDSSELQNLFFIKLAG